MSSGNMRRFLSNIHAVIGTLLILAIGILALIGPYFPVDPNHVDVSPAFSRDGHLLGIDALWRDIFARIVAGARFALTVSVCATVLGLLIAMVLGIAAGYIGGLFDEMLSRIFDVIATFPTILLAVLIVVALGPSVPAVIVAIGVAIM